MGESQATATESKERTCSNCGVTHEGVPLGGVLHCAGCGHVLGKAECTCTGNKCVCKPSLAERIHSAARKLGFKVGV